MEFRDNSRIEIYPPLIRVAKTEIIRPSGGITDFAIAGLTSINFLSRPIEGSSIVDRRGGVYGPGSNQTLL
jgi:hypothetical protein